MCFKRLNETHQIGCSSKRHGNVGILRLLDSDEDLGWLRSTDNKDNYIVLMQMDYFTESVMTELIQLKKITGVLVDKANSSRPNQYSPDLKIPNQKFGIYNSSSFEWNTFGNGLLFLDIPFPVALLTNATTIDFLRECYRKHNVGSKAECPWCSVRMKSFMFAAVDSVVCHRRSHIHNNLNPEEYCDPVGGYSVLSSVGQFHPEKPADGSVILVVARMDALSMFDGISPGFDSAMTGFVALHAVAQIVGKMKLGLELDSTPVMFALFQGESLGYMGSSRFILDMQSGSISQLNISSIRAIIELGQLGVHKQGSERNKAWVHVDEDINKDVRGELEKVVTLLVSQTSNVQMMKASHKIPPSSLQSFLKNNPKIAGVYISNHENAFTNRFYNSFLDDKDNVDIFNSTEELLGSGTSPTVTYIGDISKIVACAIYQLANSSSGSSCDDVPSANLSYIEDLFNCFGKDADCELFNSTVFEDGELSQTKSAFLTRYTGVYTEHKKYYPIFAHRALLAQNLGEVVDLSFCEKRGTVSNGTRYIKFKGPLDNDGKRTPLCYKAYTILPVALPPIFTEDELWTDSGYPSWTESRWGSFDIDIFLLPCYMQEVKTVLLGVAVILLSLPTVIFINHRLLKGTEM